MSIGGIKVQAKQIKIHISSMEKCVRNEEYENMSSILSDMKNEVEGLEDEIDETVKQAGDIRLSLEVLEGC